MLSCISFGSTAHHQISLSLLGKSAIPIALESFRRLSRVFSSETSAISFIPHQIPFEEAAQRFVAHDENRLYAPSSRKITQLVGSSGVGPLKKVLIPFFGADATIIKTDYAGQYGITRTRIIPGSNGQTQVQTYIDWYSTRGTVGSIQYSRDGAEMRIYAGFSWYSKLVEGAFEGESITEKLQPFKAEKLDADVTIDPFLMRSAIAQEIAYDRIRDRESYRAEQAIVRKTGYSNVSVNRIWTHFDSFGISSILLPAYVLQYPGVPPRILSAVTTEGSVVGPSAVSTSKVALTTAAISTVASMLMPQFSIPIRLGLVAISSILGAFGARYHLSIRYSLHTMETNTAREYNETVSETIADRKRRKITEEQASFTRESMLAHMLNVDYRHYEVIGLDPKELVTEAKVRSLFNERIKSVHPDKKGGSADTTVKLIEARDVFLRALEEKKPQVNKGVGKRFYSTYIGKKVKEPPRSVYDPRAKRLIRTVLDRKDYQKALKLVEKEEVHPDSHDEGKNTLLAEAVKRVDVSAILFAIDKLGASPDTSCDCPGHRTPLHYAVANRHYKVVRILLNRGANPNLINSFGETPYDIASSQNNEAIKQLLADRGGIPHRTDNRVGGVFQNIKGYLGAYSSKERTKLSGNRKSVIHLTSLEKLKKLKAPPILLLASLLIILNEKF